MNNDPDDLEEIAREWKNACWFLVWVVVTVAALLLVVTGAVALDRALIP